VTETLDRGEFVRLAYRLGRSQATGVLTVRPARGDAEVLVLRRGHLMAPDTDALGRAAAQRLARIASLSAASYRFDGGTAAYPPGAATRQFSLAAWARRHLEAQIDSAHAQVLVRTLAGTRLLLRLDLAPDESLCDDTDRRILAAMRVPRRLDQIWPLARTPRFRLLTFIHFLREVGAVEFEGIGAPATRRPPTGAAAAYRLLGVDERADKQAVKRAYRRLARALHPDLHPSATAERRRLLERKFSEISAAYRELVAPE
jgi:hypothetical protein